jgi:hypothetical protein
LKEKLTLLSKGEERRDSSTISLPCPISYRSWQTSCLPSTFNNLPRLLETHQEARPHALNRVLHSNLKWKGNAMWVDTAQEREGEMPPRESEKTHGICVQNTDCLGAYIMKAQSPWPERRLFPNCLLLSPDKLYASRNHFHVFLNYCYHLYVLELYNLITYNLTKHKYEKNEECLYENEEECFAKI